MVKQHLDQRLAAAGLVAPSERRVGADLASDLEVAAEPLGFLVAGQVLERWGVVPLFTTVVAGLTALAIVFAAIVLRHREADPRSPARRVLTSQGRRLR